MKESKRDAALAESPAGASSGWAIEQYVHRECWSGECFFFSSSGSTNKMSSSSCKLSCVLAFPFPFAIATSGGAFGSSTKTATLSFAPSCSLTTYMFLPCLSWLEAGILYGLIWTALLPSEVPGRETVSARPSSGMALCGLARGHRAITVADWPVIPRRSQGRETERVSRAESRLSSALGVLSRTCSTLDS